MAEILQAKTTALATALKREEERDAARQALRGFLDKIVIPAETGCFRSWGISGSG